MKVAFRTDASTDIGTGHVMRCGTLANALKARGVETSFLCRDLPGNRCDWLASEGHRVHRLPGPARTSAQDADETLETLGDTHPDWLVVDHYGLDHRWEDSVRARVDRIMALDDLGRRHECELLLDQNVLEDAQAYAASVPPDCVRLLGPRYALLRPRFAAMRGSARLGSRERVERVLIGFGGADPRGETARAIEGFLAGTDATVKATVVMGWSNAGRAALADRFGGNPRLELLDFCDDMPQLMSACDVAIGGGGISTWERACVGLPAIVTAIAQNQEPIAEALAVRGGHLYLGSHPTADDYAAALRLFFANPWLRGSCAAVAGRLCDGLGVERIAAILAPRTLNLRLARHDDAADLLAWRNAEVNRLPSFDPTPITEERHLQWLEAVLRDPDRTLLIGEGDEGPVGVLRYDFSGAQAEVSVYLVPGRHGERWGEELLRAGTRWLRDNRPGIARVRARIKADNQRSKSAFHAAGFVSESAEVTLTL